MPLLVASDLTRTYTGGSATVQALSGVSFAVERGEFVALMGPSGCGKSTLLHLCGAMDRPSTGRITLEDRDLGTLPDDELTRVRRDRIGRQHLPPGGGDCSCPCLGSQRRRNRLGGHRAVVRLDDDRGTVTGRGTQPRDRDRTA